MCRIKNGTHWLPWIHDSSRHTRISRLSNLCSYALLLGVKHKKIPATQYRV